MSSTPKEIRYLGMGEVPLTSNQALMIYADSLSATYRLLAFLRPVILPAEQEARCVATMEFLGGLLSYLNYSSSTYIDPSFDASLDTAPKEQ